MYACLPFITIVAPFAGARRPAKCLPPKHRSGARRRHRSSSQHLALAE